MKRPILVALIGTMAIGHALVRTADAQATTPALEQYLRGIGVDARERETAARGRATVKLLPTPNDRDVAVFGMIGVRAPRAAVVAYVTDPERYLAAKGRRFRPFANPPTAADVEQVAFDRSEYRDLQKCRPGACDFKLPASAMKAFVEEIDWSAPDARAQADERLRRGLLHLVTEYMARGNAGTVVYDDVRGVRCGDVFVELSAQSSGLCGYEPELERYLRSYPSGRPAGARDILYWAEDRLPKLRPTLTLNHLVVHQPPASASATFVAQKQIYASHYFEGAFELLGVVDGGDGAGEPTVYLVTVRRFRFDNLPGGLANIRGRVRSQMVNTTRSELERHRDAAERGLDSVP